MKKQLLFLFLLVGKLFLAQTNLAYGWAINPKNYPIGGDVYGLSITTDISGNVYSAGYFNSGADFDPSASAIDLISNGNEDIYFAKYSSSGSVVFAKSIGGTSTDKANSIAVDGSGNIYITGFFNGTVDFDPSLATQTLISNGGNDIFIAKYDNLGNYVFAKSIGGTSIDEALSLSLDPSGDIILTGYFNNTVDFDPGPGIQNLTANGSDAFFSKYSNSGNYIYAKKIGGFGSEQSKSLSVDVSGNIYLTGDFDFTCDFDPSLGTQTITPVGSKDIFIAKYDNNGNYLFVKGIGSSNTEIVNDITTDGSNNIYIAGSFLGSVDFDPSIATQTLTSAGGYDIFIAKYDLSGNYIYAKSMGGTASDDCNSISVDASMNVYITGPFLLTADFDPSAAVQNLIAGGFFQDIFIAKYDVNGNYIYAGSMGSNTSGDVGQANTIDNSGNLIFSGYFRNTVDFDISASVQNQTTPGINNAFITKYDNVGNYMWALTLGNYPNLGGMNEYCREVVYDVTGNVYVIGSYQGITDFDPSIATQTLLSQGQEDIYFAKYDANGNYLFVKSIGSTGYDVGVGIRLDGSGNICLTGLYTGTVDFDPSAATQTVVSVGFTDIFMAKYDMNGNFIFVKSIGASTSDNVADLFVDASGNYFITGTFANTMDFDPSPATQTITAGGLDKFFAKYDQNGNYLLAKTFGSGIPISISSDAIGNIYVGGYFNGTVDFDPALAVQNLVSAGADDIYLAKYDLNGNYLFANRIGNTGNERCYSMKTDNSGNIYVTGHISGVTTDFDPSPAVQNLVALGSNDIYFAKYDNLGNYQFAKLLGGPGSEQGQDIYFNGTDIYLTGTFDSTGDFDPSATVQNLTNTSATFDVFIAKYDLNGNYIYAKSIGGNAFDTGGSVLADPSGIVYLTGSFGLTSDFDPSLSVANLTANNNSDGFIAKYNPCTPPPSATITTLPSSLVTCSNNSVIINASGTGTISWFSSATSTNVLGVGNSFTTALLTATTVTTFTFYAEDKTCMPSLIRTPITVTVNPAPTLTITGTNPICLGNSTSLIATGASTFTWSTGPISNSITISPTTTTTYSVIGTSTAGCQNTTSISVIVNPNPIVTASTSSVTVCDMSLGCLFSNGASTYTWTGPCGFNSVQQNPCFPFASFCLCTYSVTGTDANGCKNSASVCISVNPNPTITANTSNTLICIGQTATLTSSGANTYSWSTSATGSVTAVSPTTTTSYTVTGTDLNGCTNTSSITQSVSTCAAVNELSTNNEINIFPNPAKEQITISSSSPIRLIKMFSVDGKLVLQKNNANNVLSQSINISELNAGIYFLNCITEEGERSFKIIKE